MTNNTKELFLISSAKRFKPEWLEMMALKINNLMVIPMKILKVNCNVPYPNTDFPYRSSIVVEECLDEDEWSRLLEVFRIGYNSVSDSNKT